MRLWINNSEITKTTLAKDMEGRIITFTLKKEEIKEEKQNLFANKYCDRCHAPFSDYKIPNCEYCGGLR